MKLRSDDPAVMKNFILSVKNRVTELKAASVNDQEKMKSKRVGFYEFLNCKAVCFLLLGNLLTFVYWQMEFMLETICDIKNNKKRPKEDTLQLTRTKKWLQKVMLVDFCFLLVLQSFKILFLHIGFTHLHYFWSTRFG